MYMYIYIYVYIYIYIWLVVWNMNFMTFHILGRITPTDKLIFFRGIETTNHQPDELGNLVLNDTFME